MPEIWTLVSVPYHFDLYSQLAKTGMAGPLQITENNVTFDQWSNVT